MTENTRVERRPGRGRCLIAAKNIALGEVIMTVEPLSAVLDEGQARTRCANCFERVGGQCASGGGSRCSGCKKMWYCSRACQKADWKDHRAECKAWTSQHTSVRTPTRTLRLAGRILHIMNREDASSTRIREAVDELVHHNDKRPKEQAEQFRLMAAFVARLCVVGGGEKKALRWSSAQGRKFAGLVDAALALLGKAACNVFSISNDSYSGEIGCGLYLEATAANHSCMPNASQSFHGKTLSLRCTRPILEGEEVTIGIAEIDRPGALRRQYLRASYFFECGCERCVSPAGRAEDVRLEAYACTVKKCPGVCPAPKNHSQAKGARSSQQNDEPRNTRPEAGSAQVGESPPSEKSRADASRGSANDEEPDVNASRSSPSEVTAGAKAREEENPRWLKCDTCGNASRSAEVAQRKVEAIQELLSRGRALESDGETILARQCLEQALGRAVGFLHHGNWLLSEIYRVLASVCVELQDFEAAATFAKDGLDSLRVCLTGVRPYFSPWGVNLAFTGKLLLCVSGQPHRAIPLLREAESSVRVTHGEQHPLYQEVQELLEQAGA